MGAKGANVRAAEADAVWEAAADAMAWAAAMYDRAAWTERRTGWADRSAADESARDAAASCGDAIDAEGGTDEGAIKQVAEDLRQAGTPLARAVIAFEESSRLHKAAEGWQDMAAAAYKKASRPRRSEAVYEHAEESHRQAQAAARLSSAARAGTRTLALAAGKLEKRMAAAPRPPVEEEDDRRRASADHEMLSSLQADLWDDARQACMQSAGMEKRSEERVRLAAEVERLAEAAAKRSAARAEDVLAGGTGGGPRVQEAVSAWKEAEAEATGRAGVFGVVAPDAHGNFPGRRMP